MCTDRRIVHSLSFDFGVHEEDAENERRGRKQLLQGNLIGWRLM